MATRETPQWSRRERQIMEILFRRQKATAAEIHEDMTDRPSYSAVRAHLRTLEDKGHVRHEAEQMRYVYAPVANVGRARKNALRHLVDTFFAGSPASAASALLDEAAADISPEELDQLAGLIERARKDGK